VVAQWSKVEAEFAKEYGLSLEELFSMTWRRFKVLFNGVFTWPEASDAESDPDGPEPLASNEIYKTVDWSKSEQIGPNLLEQFRGTHLPVGKEPTDG